MKKIESTFRNMLIVLILVCVISGGALGGVYVLTKSTIAAAKEKKLTEAIQSVVAPFNKLDKVDSGVDGITAYKAFNEDELVGIAIESFTTKGFSGNVKIMVGFSPIGDINKIVVLEHKETPGLGDKMSTDWNLQFVGKNPENFNLKVKKDGGNVDAITAATISSRAFCDATETAYKVFKNIK